MRFLVQYTAFYTYASVKYPFIKRRGTKGGFGWGTRADAYIYLRTSGRYPRTA